MVCCSIGSKNTDKLEENYRSGCVHHTPIKHPLCRCTAQACTRRWPDNSDKQTTHGCKMLAAVLLCSTNGCLVRCKGMPCPDMRQQAAVALTEQANSPNGIINDRNASSQLFCAGNAAALPYVLLLQHDPACLKLRTTSCLHELLRQHPQTEVHSCRCDRVFCTPSRPSCR